MQPGAPYPNPYQQPQHNPYGQYPYRQVEVGEALVKGWRAFTSRLGPFVVLAVISGLGQAVVAFAVGMPDSFEFSTQPQSRADAQRILDSLVPIYGALVLMSVVQLLVSAFQARQALDAVDGSGRSFGAVAGDTMRRLAPFVGWSLLAGILAGVAILALCVGFLIVQCMMQWVGFLALERHRSPIEGSWRGIKENLGPPVVILVIETFGGGLLGFVVGLAAAPLGIPALTQFLAGTLGGVVGAWLLCSNAVVYRGSSVNAGAPQDGGLVIPAYHDGFVAPPPMGAQPYPGPGVGMPVVPPEWAPPPLTPPGGAPPPVPGGPAAGQGWPPPPPYGQAPQAPPPG